LIILSSKGKVLRRLLAVLKAKSISCVAEQDKIYPIRASALRRKSSAIMLLKSSTCSMLSNQ
jgi:hypothetical protein